MAAEMSYATQKQDFLDHFKLYGVSPTKITHCGRYFRVFENDSKGIAYEQTSRQGLWSGNSALDSSYLTGPPIDAILCAAGFVRGMKLLTHARRYVDDAHIFRQVLPPEGCA